MVELPIELPRDSWSSWVRLKYGATSFFGQLMAVGESGDRTNQC